MKRAVLIILILLSVSDISFPEPGGQSSENVLTALIEEALINNPELKYYEELINIYKTKPPQVASFDNPRVKFAINNLPTDTREFDQEPMTQKQIILMQKFPYPGKLPLKGEIARMDTELARNEYDNKKLEIVMKLKTSFMNILFFDRAIEITEGNKELLGQFVKIAETKYSVGKGLQQDVLKARVEISKMIDKLITLQQKRKSTVAGLNTLLNRSSEDSFDVDIKLKMTSFDYTFKGLWQKAVHSHPLLQRVKSIVEQNRLRVTLAQRDYYPDFDVSFGYGQRDERTDFVSASVTMKIPLWHKNREGMKVSEERANVRRAEEQYDAIVNDISFKISDIMAKVEMSKRQLELLETGIIPQATMSLESAISGYKVNKVDFITLVNNQITLFNYEIQYHRVLADYENNLAELEAAVGARLF